MQKTVRGLNNVLDDVRNLTQNDPPKRNKSLSRPARLRVKNCTGYVNNSLINMLGQLGDTHIAICKDEEGKITLIPLDTPQGCVIVRQIVSYKEGQGQPRMFVGTHIPDGKYDVIWDEETLVARVVDTFIPPVEKYRRERIRR